MRVGIFDHQGKAQRLALALAGQGFQVVDRFPVDVLLVDYDAPFAHPRPELIERAHREDALILLYPHGARPTVQYDGIVRPDPRVCAHLVSGEGQAEVLRLIGVPQPAIPVGWFYCPLLPFIALPEVRRVLWAPCHPFGDGTLAESSRRENVRVFGELCKLLDALPELEVTVHLYGPPERNGIQWDARMRFVPSNLTVSWGEIDRADVVIADGTYAYVAVARGKPTVFTFQDVPPADDEGVRTVANWELYRDVMRHPICFSRLPLWDALEAARVGGPDCDEWKTRFIGEELNPAGFARLLSRLREEQRVEAA